MGPLDVGWWTEQDGTASGARWRGRRARTQHRAAEPAAPATVAERGVDEEVTGGTGTAAGGTSDDQRAADHRTSAVGSADRVSAEATIAAGSADPGTDRDRRKATRHAPGRPGTPAMPRTRPSKTLGDRVRTLVRGAGQTLITFGLVVLLFVVYELWVTDLMNSRVQHRLGATLKKQWNQGDDPLVRANPSRPRRPGEKITRIPLGRGIANIYIPSFGTDYVFTIVEGTDVAELEEGPGHYVDSALPGEVGNFAVAGHRVGKGSPFLNLDKLRAGAAIVIETKDYWYTYRVMGDRRTGDPQQPGNGGVKGLEVVDPADVAVIEPVPGRPGATPKLRLLTLTTCHPKFSARERLIIHAQQAGGPLAKSGGALPPALKG